MNTARDIKKKLIMVMTAIIFALGFLFVRVAYVQTVRGAELQARAYAQQTRDRLISPDRGNIYDRNMVGLAMTESVASVSVIRAQIEDPRLVAETLSRMLSMDFDYVYTKVNRRVALERIKTQVDKALADEIRALRIPGIIIDEDVRRIYPYGHLAAAVIGFVGRDNQGIIGLEARYDTYLRGTPGKILTETDARGREHFDSHILRQPPIPGDNLVLTIDSVIQRFAEQTIAKAVAAKSAQRGAIIIMNPQNGEILAMANEPGFDLNEPFTINDPALAAIWDTLATEEQMNYLNKMWRNFTINDTYEPGSTFKILTSAAGLEEGLITPESRFNCGGYRVIGGRQIKCWRYPRNHGGLDFVEGVQNSCNPVFMDIGEMLGAELFYDYLIRFGLKEKTGVDLPGEAVAIMHPLENIGSVDLAIMAFGQSLTMTPLQLVRLGATIINGGYLVTPHVGSRIVDNEGNTVRELDFGAPVQVISTETSAIMKEILESVVYVGTGHRTYIPGYRIGGKTATSQKLPRGSRRYISSFLAFAPAENPQIIALVLIDEPQGAYYGGQVAGPVMKELLANVLPYLGIAPIFNEDELAQKGVGQVTVPDLRGQRLNTAKNTLQTLGLDAETQGEGDRVAGQFPIPGELVNQGTKIILDIDNFE